MQTRAAWILELLSAREVVHRPWSGWTGTSYEGAKPKSTCHSRYGSGCMEPDRGQPTCPAGLSVYERSLAAADHSQADQAYGLSAHRALMMSAMPWRVAGAAGAVSGLQLAHGDIRPGHRWAVRPYVVCRELGITHRRGGRSHEQG